MARDTFEGDWGGYPFSHYDASGNPIDTNGQVMLGEPKGPAQIPGGDPSGVGAGGGWYGGDEGLGDVVDGPGDGGVDPPPTPTLTPTPAPIGGGGGGSATGAENPFGPWGGVFHAPTPKPLPSVPLWDPSSSVPHAPTFNPPTYTPPPAFSYKDFVGPTIEEAMASPGYQFRLGQGTDRLQNAASARGTLNDSGTLKALIDYGQEAASQEYDHVWNRDFSGYKEGRGNALDTYNANYKTQYTDPYAASYRAAQDQFAPRMTEYDALVASGRDLNQAALLGYSTDAANIQHQNDTGNTNVWNDYLLGYQDFQNRRNLGVDFALRS